MQISGDAGRVVVDGEHGQGLALGIQQVKGRIAVRCRANSQSGEQAGQGIGLAGGGVQGGGVRLGGVRESVRTVLTGRG